MFERLVLGEIAIPEAVEIVLRDIMSDGDDADGKEGEDEDEDENDDQREVEERGKYESWNEGGEELVDAFYRCLCLDYANDAFALGFPPDLAY